MHSPDDPNTRLAFGFNRYRQSDVAATFMRFQAQTESLYRRAVEDFHRRLKLRGQSPEKCENPKRTQRQPLRRAATHGKHSRSHCWAARRTAPKRTQRGANRPGPRRRLAGRRTPNTQTQPAARRQRTTNPRNARGPFPEAHRQLANPCVERRRVPKPSKRGSICFLCVPCVFA